jgi:hypothetical protein
MELVLPLRLDRLDWDTQWTRKRKVQLQAE